MMRPDAIPVVTAECASCASIDFPARHPLQDTRLVRHPDCVEYLRVCKDCLLMMPDGTQLIGEPEIIIMFPVVEKIH